MPILLGTKPPSLLGWEALTLATLPTKEGGRKLEAYICFGVLLRQANQPIYPKYPMLYPQGLLVPLDTTAANRLTPRALPIRAGGLHQLIQSAGKKAWDTHTWRMRKYVQINIRTKWGEPLWRAGEEPTAHTKASCHNHKVTAGTVGHTSSLLLLLSGGIDPSQTLCGYGLLPQHWGKTWALPEAPPKDQESPSLVAAPVHCL